MIIRDCLRVAVGRACVDSLVRACVRARGLHMHSFLFGFLWCVRAKGESEWSGHAGVTRVE
jgi:hypothetical protein